MSILIGSPLSFSYILFLFITNAFEQPYYKQELSVLQTILSVIQTDGCVYYGSSNSSVLKRRTVCKEMRVQVHCLMMMIRTCLFSEIAPFPMSKIDGSEEHCAISECISSRR